MPEEKEKNNYCTSWPQDSKQLNNNGMLLEDERPVVPGVTVKAATVDALVDLLIESFLPTGGLKEENSNFARVMLLMHQWFTSSENLAHCLISRFWDSETALHNCQSSCPHTYKTVTECTIYQYRARICQTFRYWIRMFPIHFDLNSALTTIVKDFQNHLYNQSFCALADHLDLSKLPSYDWARSMSVRNPPAKHTRKISLVYDHLEPSELAEHITFLEHKVMRRITFSDFKAYAECGTPQDIPKLERSISLFNGLSQWIQWMVLSKSLPQQRADVIVKFVHVAQKLLQQNNFNSLMSVVGGLSHSALARLTNTMACVPSETKKTLAELGELLASASNFSNYRRALMDAKGFKIPILGVHMKDLISLHVALPDTIENGLVNFRKIAQLSLIFQELWELQNSVPKVAVNADLVNTLRLSLDTPYTEDELYELSLAKEPRNSLSPQSSPTKLAAFSEWAAGIGGPADTETLERFYQSIVEVIMKNYDQDKDGYLSAEEFEAAYMNFPYIDPFNVIDVDGDGLISKSEFVSYFLTANSKAIRVAFQHDFNETTYFKPTFCAHCAGLLWGLIKQGYKCRDCGINAHKHCKELVVMECRRTSASTSRSNSFAAADGPKLKTRMQRPWRRQLKSSHSDGDSSYSSRTSTESDLCSCDNGFVLVDEPSPGSARNSVEKDYPRSPLTKTPPSPLKLPSSPLKPPPSPRGCGCKQEFKVPSSPRTPTSLETDSEQTLLLQKVPARKNLIS
ncbi:ras guanyl-releasing protein 3-like isoform X2 [Argiope bruennichi]|uniref:ras guanyl-releasing protein 3-like isoform X2 n=1 Tax=Argiope bruennichi TaxID=94029 RepID=UPI0024940F1E|nr:ras guanyl-releasing protein 3-like isoform X2 [Argiope bruennichi]